MKNTEWLVVDSIKGVNLNAASIKPIISYEDFEKIDIRIGTIERVEIIL